jgi:hypothetical protein
LAIIGSPVSVMRAAVDDLQEELGARTHLENPRVAWHDERTWISVIIDESAFDALSAGEVLAEEVFEAFTAVVGNFEYFRVEVIEVVQQK